MNKQSSFLIALVTTGILFSLTLDVSAQGYSTSVGNSSGGTVIGVGAGGGSAPREPKLTAEQRKQMNEAVLLQIPKATATTMSFQLKQSNGNIFGPYSYCKGTPMEIGRETFELTDASEKTFSIFNKSKEKSFGPFRCKNGTEVVLGNETFSFAMSGAYITGTVNCPALMSKRVPITLIKVSDKSLQDLYNLAYRFSATIVKHQEDITPKMPISPVIKGHPGFNRTPDDIKPSQHAVNRSSKTSSIRMKSYFRKFTNDNKTASMYPTASGKFRFGPLPPGRYIVCSDGTAKSDKKETGASSQLVMWWELAVIESNESYNMNFSTSSVKYWDTLFKYK